MRGPSCFPEGLMLRIVPLDRTNLAAAAAIDAGFDVEANWR